MVDKKLLESVTARISEVCSRGPLIYVAGNIPSYTIHAYNRIIEDTGFVIGWTDKENHIINFENLSINLEQSLNLYLRARDGMAKFGIDEYVAQQMSPVFVVKTLLNGKIESSIIPLLESSHIYSAIALLQLADFHEHCKSFLYDDLFPETIENLSLLTLAQSYLLVAQEATNEAYNIMYRANDFVREKISTTDEITLQLEIEKARFKNKIGGKFSPYEEFKQWAIKEAEVLWSKEREQRASVTKLTHMAEKLKYNYTKKQSNLLSNKAISEMIPRDLDTIKNYIRPIANNIAPQAVKGGRPENK